MKYVFNLIILLSLVACKKDNVYQNPYLEDVSFSTQINLDLPEYAPLKYANNSVLVQNVGIKGVIVFNTGHSYQAFEASDPNHYPSACSTMQPNQFTCSCNCEGNTYSLYTGQITQGDGQYSLKPYHVSQSGNTLHISN
jgi:nitrite reductase/ring-hydroxylating ferredoxin subunit